MSVHHSPLGVNVRCHLICLFFWLPMFLLLWEITNLPLTSLLSMVLEHPPALPWWYWWEQLIIWAAASSPITHDTTWCLGPLAQSECEGHSDQRGSTLVSPPSPSPLLFLLSTFPSERAYSLLVCACLSEFLPVFLAVSAAGMLGMYLLHRCHVSEWRLLSIWMTCHAGML